jgi:hypothetical protein
VQWAAARRRAVCAYVQGSLVSSMCSVMCTVGAQQGPDAPVKIG